MLCTECNEIVIEPSSEPSRILIRKYQNIWSLAGYAQICSLCQLIYDDPQQLRKARLEEILSLWGDELYQRALNLSPIHVYLVTYPAGCYVTWETEVDTSLLEGYSRGLANITTNGRIYRIDMDEDSAETALSEDCHANGDMSADILSLQASKWLDDCTTNHHTCGNATETNYDLPTRVLDVSNTVDNQPAPVIAQSSPGDIGQYIALSFVRGKSPSTLKQHNFEEFTTRGIPFESLPTTFRDAILLTRSLGFRYLWIDALCIIQDSIEDWEEQSSQVFKVFANATLVLRAGNGIDTQQGLFKNADRTKHPGVALKFKSSDSSSTVCHVRPSLPVDEIPDRNGWTLQEGRLAKRAITFNTGEILWDCHESHLSGSESNKTEDSTPDFTIPICYSFDQAGSEVCPG